MIYEWKDKPKEKDDYTWWSFMDMHSGGRQKTDYSHIFIEANSESEACGIFESIFGCNPDNITCDCCGSDFSIYGGKDLKSLTTYHRNVPVFGNSETIEQRYGRKYFKEQICFEKGEIIPDIFEHIGYNDDPYESYISLEDYMKKENVLIVPRNEK